MLNHHEKDITGQYPSDKTIQGLKSNIQKVDPSDFRGDGSDDFHWEDNLFDNNPKDRTPLPEHIQFHSGDIFALGDRALDAYTGMDDEERELTPKEKREKEAREAYEKQVKAFFKEKGVEEEYWDD